MTETDLSVFSHLPTLSTDRLILRKMKISDSADMFDYARQEETTRYLLWSPHASQSASRRYLIYLQGQYRAGNFYDFALVDRESGKMIGTCGFSSFTLTDNSAEIGYVLNPAYWGKGLATEAVRRILQFAFVELSLHRVTARIMEGNLASKRVAEKCGMRLEATHIKSLRVKGTYHTIHEYALLSEEYFKAQSFSIIE